MSDEPLLEGRTRIAAPRVNTSPHGPGRREKGLPFYNPGMALNRDLSVLLAVAEGRRLGREIDVADALAGTGARSLRIANEAAVPLIVHANDANPVAIAAIRAGAEANAIPPGRLTVSEGDATAFLASRRFDIVDIDPHGSPMPFLDAAVRATRFGGLVMATATDTGALAGTFPRVARRRYDAHHGLHAAPWRAEAGLRILGGALVRSAARFDRCAVHVLSVAHGHWMRVVARLDGARKDADHALRLLRAAVVDEGTGNGRFLGPNEAPADGQAWAGPLWSGPLHEPVLVAALQEAALATGPLACPAAVAGLLAIMADEATAPAFWVVPDALQGQLGRPPRRDALIQRLRDGGHAACRTHLDPQGVRTDAGRDALREAWGPLAASVASGAGGNAAKGKSQ